MSYGIHAGPARETRLPHLRRKCGLGLGALVVVGLVGCDFDVTNPGPVDDAVLNDPAAHAAMVNGMGRQLSLALNWLVNHSGAVTLEHTPSGLVGGSPGYEGIPVRIRQGILNPEETSPHWNAAQQARWTAEDGIRRLRDVMGGEFGGSRMAAQALVHAGFSNRLLGENMCQAVINGGGAEPREVFFQRAIAQFTEAAEVASQAGAQDLVQAANAGRASVHVHLGEWSNAVEYAGRVPTDFVYQARFTTDLINNMYRGATTAVRSQSVWNTFFEAYFLETEDPRTPWEEVPGFPVGGPAPEGAVTWYPQRKYVDPDAPTNLATGREMRLIEAENLLRNGQWEAAVSAINDLRTAIGVPEWEAESLEEAWTVLKTERFIELWLEARRLGDVRRWRAENVPGGAMDLRGPDSCFPIPNSEIETNPNL